MIVQVGDVRNYRLRRRFARSAGRSRFMVPLSLRPRWIQRHTVAANILGGDEAIALSGEGIDAI